jgi:hypothetical protein
VTTAQWAGYGHLKSDDIRFVGLEDEFVQGSRHCMVTQLNGITAPEEIFTNHSDQRIDLWGAGITVGELP